MTNGGCANQDMRHVRIPRRERIRKTEVVRVVDNTEKPMDPHEALLYHLEHVKRIVEDAETVFTSKDLASIRRSITAIENKVIKNEEK